LTKQDLINEVADTAGIKKGQAEKIINVVFNAIKRSLSEGEAVTIVGFGRFVVIKMPSRRGWNPALKEKVIIPSRQKIRFFPSKVLYKEIHGKQMEKRKKDQDVPQPSWKVF